MELGLERPLCGGLRLKLTATGFLLGVVYLGVSDLLIGRRPFRSSKLLKVESAVVFCVGTYLSAHMHKHIQIIDR